MHNGFITIWLMTSITLVIGCASTPEPNSEPKEAPVAAQANHCNKQNNRVYDNYPWSIPGYHDTLTKQSAPFSITQTRGEPDQFIICSDCPCVTPKSATEEKPLKKKEKTRSAKNHMNHIDEDAASLLPRHLFFASLPMLFAFQEN